MSLISTAKEVVELVQKADNIELYGKVLELQAAALEEQEGKGRLLARIEDLERARDVSARLTFEDNRYWLDVNGEREGPFCSKCWDADSLLMRLHQTSREGDAFLCPSCERAVYDMAKYT